MVTDIVEAPAEMSALAISQGSPAEIVARATEMADVLKTVIRDKGLYSKIQGREYVRVEGWTTLGAMVGVFPQIEWTKPMEDSQGKKLGWEARCIVATPQGAVVGAGEAECTYSEKNWADRDDFALRSMAQTRAVSKAMRLPLSWVITLAGFEATPAEEMAGPAPASTPEPTDQPRAAGREINGYKEISAKYPGQCGDCGVTIEKGEQCFWSPKDGQYVYHEAHVPA